MRNLLIGLVAGFFLSGQVAHAIETTMESNTVRELLCGLALCGFCSSTSAISNPNNKSLIVNAAYDYGTALAKKLKESK